MNTGGLISFTQGMGDRVPVTGVVGDLKCTDCVRQPSRLLTAPNHEQRPIKARVVGAGAQCKCRSSDQSKEPGWHPHRQPSWHPPHHHQQQKAQDSGHPSSPSFSFLLPKLFPSQQRAKTGWQGSFQLSSDIHVFNHDCLVTILNIITSSILL